MTKKTAWILAIGYVVLAGILPLYVPMSDEVFAVYAGLSGPVGALFGGNVVLAYIK